VPTAPTSAAIVHPVPPAGLDPVKWGRVDPDGTVYLRTDDGERAIGSWQAGAPDEGLAHFARRFDDLLTEAELLAARLSAGGSEPKHALNSARQLRDGLADAAVLGDIAGLAKFLDALVVQAEDAVNGARSAREASRTQAIARKEELAGAHTHAATSGVCHFTAPDDAACLSRIRELIGFLPANKPSVSSIRTTIVVPERCAPMTMTGALMDLDCVTAWSTP